MAALPLAVVLSLAADPRCGARLGIESARIAAVATKESGLDPLAVGLNGPGGGAHHFGTAADAIAYARALDAAGRSYDVGLTQINNRSLAGDGLTLATAFDACSSIRAAYHHLANDFEAAAWAMAHSRYNTGSLERGAAYAASVQSIIARVRTVHADSVPAPTEPAAPPDPTEPPVWDLWAHQEWLERKDVEPSPAPAQQAPLLITEATALQETTP